MTREQTINRLKTDIYKYADFSENPNEDEFWNAFDMAIKALKQEPCEDCISRAEVLRALDEKFLELQKAKQLPENKTAESKQLGVNWCINTVKELPSVTPQEPKIGHWINAKVGKLFPSNDYKCSECGNILDFNGVNCGRGDANYCPNCGAKMESEG